ncbi:MAG: NfeD family protein [Azospirillaceae bacterium]|nr:NfeD family protein [Azospirillaceae bacterium]
MPNLADWTPHAWHWLAAGVALALVELLLPGIGLLWLGVAGMLVGAVLFLFPAFGLVGQLVLFALLSVALLVATRRLLGPGRATSQQASPLNERTSLYVGRVLTLETAITNGQGRAHLDDGTWIVQASQDLPAGSTVRVVGVDGTALKVEAA